MCSIVNYYPNFPWRAAAACGAATALATGFWKLSRGFPKRNVSDKPKLVAITGCDSGLGFSMANWALDAGYAVLAGCLDAGSEGALMLRAKNSELKTGSPGIFVQKIDVSVEEDVANFATRCEELLTSLNAELYAWIPNAALLIAGEIFWLTHEQMEVQFQVNFWGAVKMTRAMEKTILKHKSKIIVVTSDCAEIPLPKLGVYAASKGALELWARGMRLELQKYGVFLSCFRPGSFPQKSRLMYGVTRQLENIRNNLKTRDTYEAYKDHFEVFANFYSNIFQEGSIPSVTVLEDKVIRNGFMYLLEADTKSIDVYEVDELGVTIFKLLVKYLPQRLSDKLLLKTVEPFWPPEKQVL